jgi:hypothetical protein
VSYIDRFRFYSVLAWVGLALVVTWLYVLNGRVDRNVRETRAAAAANANAVIFLCDTNQILQALASSAVDLLSSEQRVVYTQSRFDTIQVFNAYVDVLANRQPCREQARVARASNILVPPVAATHRLPVRPLRGLRP